MLRNLIIISIGWSIIILVISGLPGDSLPDTKLALIPHFDKLVHMGMYFPLAFFLIAEFDLSKRKVLMQFGSLFTLILVGLYGGIIELAQERFFVHRSADWLDLLFDLIGGLLALIAYYFVFRKLFHSWARKD